MLRWRLLFAVSILLILPAVVNIIFFFTQWGDPLEHQALESTADQKAEFAAQLIAAQTPQPALESFIEQNEIPEEMTHTLAPENQQQIQAIVQDYQLLLNKTQLELARKQKNRSLLFLVLLVAGLPLFFYSRSKIRKGDPWSTEDTQAQKDESLMEDMLS